MAFISLKNIFAQTALASPEQVESWSKAWRVAAENGSQDTLLDFLYRESGTSEEVFLQQLAKVLDWPYLQLRAVQIPTEARNRISTKVAFQYFVLPTDFQDGTLQVAVSNPFDTAHAQRGAVRCARPGAICPRPQEPRSRKRSRSITASAPKPSMKWPKDEPLELARGR